MARINLLPWRDNIRKERQQQFVAMLVIMVLITGAIMFGVHMYYEDRIQYRTDRINYLKQKVADLNIKIKKIREYEATRRNLKKRIDKVIALERNRSEVVRLFREVTFHLPKGVHLKSLSQKNHQVVLKGIALDNNDISRYILNLEKSDWLTNLGLDIITSKGTKKTSNNDFIVTADQTRPEDKKKMAKLHGLGVTK
jgi:type IV pilus assembly protein PilN